MPGAITPMASPIYPTCLAEKRHLALCLRILHEGCLRSSKTKVPHSVGVKIKQSWKSTCYIISPIYV